MTTKPWTSVVRRELSGARRVAVLGVGNPDRGDDGAGLACVRALRKVRPPLSRRVRLIEAGSVPENFTASVRRFSPSHVIVVDAARAGRRPGAVFPVDPRRIAHQDVSSHRAPLSWLARYLTETVGCHVVLIGIQPGRTKAPGPLSSAVGKSAERVAAGLARILEIVRTPKNGARTIRARKRPRRVRSSSA
ncbi:MAG: hydrogenase 3 maturation endopeptidase HyCI [Candidatus Aminicenantes bacterium]|nr:hydrogenase 3 maturation endopeptidase HyCI [Candidatus Aminicenantes bacterium]